MAEIDSIGELSVTISGDYSGLQGDIDAASALASQGAQAISNAIAAALQTPDEKPATEAFTAVSAAAHVGGDDGNEWHFIFSAGSPQLSLQRQCEWHVAGR